MRMKNLKFILFCTAAFGIPLLGHAQDNQGQGFGKISRIQATRHDAVFVYLDEPVWDSVPCSTAGHKLSRFVIRPSSPGGKAQMSLVLAAYAAGRKIRIRGNGRCDVWKDTEGAGLVMLDQQGGHRIPKRPNQ